MNTTPSKEEYLMLRTEILQYIQNYHNTRSMMYASSGAVLAFLFGNNVTEPLMYLLPLFIIIPAYLAAVNFWLSISTDSAYLMVFHEEMKSEFQWESRYTKLSQARNLRNPSLMMNTQPLSYISVAALCVIFWACKIYSAWSNYCPYEKFFELAVGVLCMIVCFIVFKKNKTDRKEELIQAWRRIRDEDTTSVSM